MLIIVIIISSIPSRYFILKDLSYTNVRSNAPMIVLLAEIKKKHPLFFLRIITQVVRNRITLMVIALICYNIMIIIYNMSRQLRQYRALVSDIVCQQLLILY